MQAEWYSDYLSGTGFGAHASTPKAHAPLPQNTPFQQEYQDQVPMVAQAIPGTTTGTDLLPGQAPLPAAAHARPYQHAAPQVVTQKDGTQPTRRTRQVHFEAVGVGKQSAPVVQALQKQPAAQPVAQPVAQAEEKQEAKTSSRNLKYAAAACAVTALLSSFGVMMKSKYDREFAVIAVVMILLAVGLATTSVTKSKENKVVQNEKQDEAVGLARNTGEEDPVIAAKQPDPQDTLAQRYAAQGLDAEALEGPRSHLGYQRSAPTPDGRPVLSQKDLMRSQRHLNMDAATFEEYMRRMNGESVVQVAQVQPYYTFNAQWENRPEIDDSVRFHAIGDVPDQMQRKSLYRQPRMQQAGARRMHLKDPPPGSNDPLEKVHPWLEQEPDAAPVAFSAEPGERLVAEYGHSAFPQRPVIQELPEETDPMESTKTRLAFNPKDVVGQPDKDFLETLDVTSEKKKRITSIQAGKKEQGEQSQGIHLDVDEKQQSDPNSFEAAFEAKDTPDEQAVEKAMQDVRR